MFKLTIMSRVSGKYAWVLESKYLVLRSRYVYGSYNTAYDAGAIRRDREEAKCKG